MIKARLLYDAERKETAEKTEAERVENIKEAKAGNADEVEVESIEEQEAGNIEVKSEKDNVLNESISRSEIDHDVAAGGFSEAG